MDAQFKEFETICREAHFFLNNDLFLHVATRCVLLMFNIQLQRNYCLHANVKCVHRSAGSDGLTYLVSVINQSVTRFNVANQLRPGSAFTFFMLLNYSTQPIHLENTANTETDTQRYTCAQTLTHAELFPLRTSLRNRCWATTTWTGSDNKLLCLNSAFCSFLGRCCYFLQSKLGFK